MKHAIFTLLLFILGPQAWAQASPPCLPKQWGSTGSEYLRGSVDGYGWLGWTCMVNGAPQVYGFVWEPGYVVQHPESPGSTPNQIARSYYALNVGRCVSPGCNSARIAMRAALEP